MRNISAAMVDTFRGSASNVSVVHNIWYDGSLVYSNVPTKTWQMTWDSTRAVMGQSSFEFYDADGVMTPWSYSDPLNVGGGKVQTKLIVGSASIDLGFQRITRCDVAENWSLYTVNGNKVWVPGTHLIKIQADDMTTQLATDTYMAPESAPTGATVFSELRRVATGVMDVIIDPALTDRSVPSTVVYTQDRLSTIQQLADAISAGLRVNGGGQLQVYKPSSTSVWTFAGGAHDADLMGTQRSTQYQGLYNAVVSSNTLANGSLIQGYAYEQGGDLAYSGPHGHVPYKHQANFSTSQDEINKDAASMLATLIKQRASTIPFTASFNPAIETGDAVTLMMPIFDGTEQPLPGVISSVSIGGSGGVNVTADYTVQVQDSDIKTIGIINKKKRFSFHD